MMAQPQALKNLSGVARRLSSMSTLNNTFDPNDAFSDPVAYLEQFGIDAELLVDSDEGLPVAA